MPELKNFHGDIEKTLAAFQTQSEKSIEKIDSEAIADIQNSLSIDLEPNLLYIRLKSWTHILSNEPGSGHYLKTHLEKLVNTYKPIFETGQYLIIDTRFEKALEPAGLVHREEEIIAQQETIISKEKLLLRDIELTTKIRSQTIQALAQLNTLVEKRLIDTQQKLIAQESRIAILEKERADLEKSLHEAIETKQTLANQLADNTVIIKGKEEVIANYESQMILRTEEKEALQKQVDELASLNAKLKQDLEILRADLDKERGIRANAEEERNLALQRLHQIEIDLAKYQQAYATLQQQNKELLQKLDATNVTVKSLQQDNAVLTQELQKARAIIAGLEAEKSTIAAKLNATQVKLSSTEQTSESLQTTIITQTDKIEELADEVERLKLGAVKMMELQGEAAKQEGATTPTGEEARSTATVVTKQGIFRHQETQQSATTRAEEQRKVVGHGRH
jgi:chromosome segregation ATPase